MHARSGCFGRSSPKPRQSRRCCSLRCSLETGRLYRHVRADCRRQPYRCAAPAQHQAEKRAIKEGRIPEDWKDRPAKLRQKDRATPAGRSSSPGQSQERLNATARYADPGLRVSKPCLDRLRLRLRSQMGGNRRGRHEGARLREGLLDKTNTARASGPIPPIGRRRMRRSWRSTASPAAFTARSPRGALCPGLSGGPTTPNRKSARVSSMCSPHKRTEWICSSAPSGSRGQPRRSAWPISSTTSNGYCVCVDGWTVAPQMRPLTANHLTNA